MNDALRGVNHALVSAGATFLSKEQLIQQLQQRVTESREAALKDVADGAAKKQLEIAQKQLERATREGHDCWRMSWPDCPSVELCPAVIACFARVYGGGRDL